MEWSTKWGWENLAAYGSKAMESPKKLHLAELVMADDGEIEAGSFNMSGNGNSSGVSGSDGGFHGSSGKSSVSASTDSSTKDGTQTPNFMFMGFEGSFNLSTNVKMRGTEVSRTSPAMEASIGSVEPVIGLKLGKRTYFENNFAGGNVKSTSLSVTPTESAVTQKKTKSSGKNANISRCQVEGCNVDLSMAKEYHQKHRVCGFHSKSPRVVIGGQERRFCQQCSRFHGLSEFDEKKRSCRRRLSDHNTRRRKPPQETMQFSSTGISSSFYGGRQQLTFLLNDSPFTTTHSVTPANSTWDPTCNSKFTLTKDYPFKCNNYGGTPEPLHMSGVRLQPVTNMNGNSFNGFLSSKSFQSEVPSPGSKGSLISSSHIDAAAPVYRRAFSLLSNNSSWGGSCAPESVPIQHHTIMQEKDTSCITYQHPTMNAAIQEGVQLSFPDFWPPSTGHHSTHPSPRVQSLDTNTNFQEIQHLEMPMPEEADFYSNVLNLT